MCQLYQLVQLIFTTIPFDGYNYYPYFTEKEVEPKISNLPKLHS
jgi:hypothetical protein